MPETPLDIEDFDALRAYLCETGRTGREEALRCRVLSGGVSNRTVLVEREAKPAWVLKQALPKLRVAADWFSDPRRIQVEAAGMRWLAQLAPPGAIPEIVFEDRDRHLLAMTAVPQPHANWKALLLSGTVDSDHVRQFGGLLGSIHRNAFLRRDELAEVFADTAFFESLRLEPYYEFTATQVPEATAFLRDLVATTKRHRLTLVHGDFSPKNILIHDSRLILLDHEVIHFGDPAFDVGFSLTHLLSKAHHLGNLRDRFVEAANEHWHSYLNALGDVPWVFALEGRAVRHTLACLLARVRGRSPLEYLDAAERQRQQETTLAVMRRPPDNVPTLIEQWIARL